jgi:hypothetical protein
MTLEKRLRRAIAMKSDLDRDKDLMIAAAEEIVRLREKVENLELAVAAYKQCFQSTIGGNYLPEEEAR